MACRPIIRRSHVTRWHLYVIRTCSFYYHQPNPNVLMAFPKCLCCTTYMYVAFCKWNVYITYHQHQNIMYLVISVALLTTHRQATLETIYDCNIFQLLFGDALKLLFQHGKHKTCTILHMSSNKNILGYKHNTVIFYFKITSFNGLLLQNDETETP